MKKVKLVQAIFTQEEIAAINTKNIKLEEENARLVKNLAEYKNEITDLKEKIRKMEEAEEKFFEFMKIYVMSKSEYKDLEQILLTKENKLEFLVSILK